MQHIVKNDFKRYNYAKDEVQTVKCIRDNALRVGHMKWLTFRMQIQPYWTKNDLHTFCPKSEHESVDFAVSKDTLSFNMFFKFEVNFSLFLSCKISLFYSLSRHVKVLFFWIIQLFGNRLLFD